MHSCLWSLEEDISHRGAMSTEMGHRCGCETSRRESWEAPGLSEQKSWRSQMEGSEDSGPREKRATRSTAKRPLGNRGAHRMRSGH